MSTRKVGLYIGAQTVIDDPGYLDALQDAVGLNLLLMGGPVALSTALRDSAPIVTPQGRQGVGMSWSDDDALLRRAIEVCHGRGIAVWFGVGGWHGVGETYREFCVRDLWDRPLYEVARPRHALETGLAICPSRPEVNEWMNQGVAEIAQGYDVDGVNISHARHTAPAYIPAWWTCGCAHCQRRAADWGYDFARLRTAVETFLARLRRLTPAHVRNAASVSLGFVGLQQLLGLSGGLLEWLEFRAAVISAGLRGLQQAVHAATARPVVFGSDSFPPSFALLAGHSYRDLAGAASDYTSTLISHVGIFVYATLASFADLLRQSVDGLDEADALRLSYAAFGYDRLEMPAAIADLHLGNAALEETSAPLAEVVEKELALARALNPGTVPSYPVIKGHLWSRQTVERLVRSAAAMGHDGIIFQGTTALTSYVQKQ